MNAHERNIVGEALATMQRRSLPIGRLAQMKRICAVHGTVWAAQYREMNGRWHLERCVRPTPGGSAQGGVVSEFVIDSENVETNGGEVCPWCGCGPKDVDGELTLLVRCSACGNSVCLGRTVGNVFRCCDQCGKTGRIGGTITNYTASDVNTVARGAGCSADVSAALPAPSRLQLTNGRRN